MTWLDFLYAIGALLFAIGGTVLVVRELRRRERRAADRQIDQLVHQVERLREDALAYRSWAHDLATMLTDAGMKFPPAPVSQRTTEAETPLSELVRRRGLP